MLNLVMLNELCPVYSCIYPHIQGAGCICLTTVEKRLSFHLMYINIQKLRVELAFKKTLYHRNKSTVSSRRALLFSKVHKFEGSGYQSRVAAEDNAELHLKNKKKSQSPDWVRALCMSFDYIPFLDNRKPQYQHSHPYVTRFKKTFLKFGVDVLFD